MNYRTFQTAENRRRIGELRKSEAVENRIREINQALAPLAQDLQGDDESIPTIFVYGLPRSGTTLCQQLIAYGLEVGYINNVVAAFWTAPVHGIAVSRQVHADVRNGAYESTYGKTREPSGVHEFSYFWHDVLGIRAIEDLLRFGDSTRVDWPQARRRVASIAQAFGLPTLFKTDFAGEFAREFSEWMPRPLFVHVRRDLGDVALSLLRARLDYYGDRDTWWSTYPPNYQDIEHLDFANQIAGQVVGLDAAYRRASLALDPGQVIEIDYPDMVARPEAFLRELVDRIKERYSVEIRAVARPPHLEPRSRAATSPDERAVVDALASWRA